MRLVQADAGKFNDKGGGKRAADNSAKAAGKGTKGGHALFVCVLVRSAVFASKKV